MTNEPAYRLLIHCSEQHAELGLLDGDRWLGRAVTPPGQRTAKTLVPTIHELLRVTGVACSQLQLISTTYGPGSFTGLRIGVTTAKALAYASQIPLVGINTLDILLLAARDQLHTSGAKAIHLHAIKSAYRGLTYWKHVTSSRDQPRPAFDQMAVLEKLAALRRYRTEQNEIASNPIEVSAASAESDSMAAWSCDQPAANATVWPEARVTSRLWTTIHSTTMIDQSDWQRMRESPSASPNHAAETGKESGEPDFLVYADSDESQAAELAGDGPEIRMLPIQPEQLLPAMANLTWCTLFEVPCEQLSPERLQPVYYRRSAAEEAMGL